jgi:hypothetical protein
MPSSVKSFLAMLIVAANGSPALGAGLLLNTETTTVSVNLSEVSILQLPLKCRDFSTLVSTTALPHNQQSGVVAGAEPTDVQGGPVSSIPGAFPGVPAGALFTFVNNSSTSKADFTAQITCAQYAGQTSTIVFDTTLAPGQFGSTMGACPAGEFALGGGYRASPTVNLSHYLTFSTGDGLEDRPGGVNPPPDAYQYDAFNATNSTQVIRGFTYCYDVAGAQMWIASLNLAPGERRFLAGALSSDLKGLGVGGAGGSDAIGLGETKWQIGFGFNFTYQGTAALKGGGLFGVFFQNVQSPLPLPRKSATPVVIGIVYVPASDAPPPVSIVPVIEYYAPSLDHYFITSIPLEIAALDNQTIPGWQRTGQSFNAYATGSDGPVGRVPVCRDYGSPAAGLDSHFYTASALECLDVITKFAGAWLLESGEVFQINLPDIFTGICPAGTVPVYRLWNQRVDSNHRYTTSLMIRNQMLAKGYVSEGYGPLGVALCAQP